MRVAVIGGGLAGITAALALAEAGDEVTLLEARPRLGGATASFSRDGLTVDTGQHVFLRCCLAYRELLQRLGVAAHAPLQDRFDVAVLSPHGRARLRRTSLPGPLQMFPALATYRFLPLLSRAAVSRAALAFGRVKVDDPATDEIRLGDWLSARGQGERARRVLWDLFVIASLNIAGDDASLALAAYVVQQALLGKTGAADIGVPRKPLGELHGEAGAAALARAGVTVRLGAKVTAVKPAPRPTRQRSIVVDDSSTTFRVELRDEEAVTADAVVLAVPHEAAARLIPEGALPREQVEGWAGLGAAPIVNVHVIYDRKVLDEPFVAAVDSPVQWVFDRTEISGFSGPGQYLAISLSAADEYVDTPVEQLREQFLPALEAVLPQAAQANVKEFFVTRERRATFRQVPGSGRLRPRAATRMPGLVLAGSWTATGWPDTMESAVRSGLSAATELRSHRAHRAEPPNRAKPPNRAEPPNHAKPPNRADDSAAPSSVADGPSATEQVAPMDHRGRPSPAANWAAAGTNRQISGFVVNSSVRDGSVKEVRS
jgi:squalene-associated FAD-dependent desaturase